ncbi:MAG: hypothetical protein M3Z02_09540, partial [Actinomycetota bacterium]|nr:hypothetical protein [Actinomycetota bacterium]
LGGPAGLVWALVSPRVAVQTGPSGPQLLEPETKAFVAADGLFLLVTSIVGLICGLLAWRLARRYGIPVLLALVVGGLLASLVAWKTGRLLGLHDYRVVLRSGAAGGRASMNVELRATGVLVGWAVAAVVGYGGCVAASLARHPESAPADVPDRWRP